MRTAATILIALIMVAACAHPDNYSRINSWISTHTTVEHVEVAGRSCGQLLDGHIIQLDPSCGDVPWYYWHEVGHALDAQIFNHPWGDIDVNNEKLAQCVAEVVLGYSPRYSPDDVAKGYWDCPDPYLSQVRNLMIVAGVW